MNILDNVANEKRFVFWDSTSARNVKELCNKVKIMSPNIFKMYVNEKKNDFADWIKNEYNDRILVTDIIKCPRKGEILACLQDAVDGAGRRKAAMLNSITQRSEKEQEKLLSVVAKPKNEKAFFIPDSPFFTVLSKKGKGDKREFLPVREFDRPVPGKKVLIDDIIEPAQEKSNVFKAEDTSSIRDVCINAGKIQQLNVRDIINRIKEVHR